MQKNTSYIVNFSLLLLLCCTVMLFLGCGEDEDSGGYTGTASTDPGVSTDWTTDGGTSGSSSSFEVDLAVLLNNVDSSYNTDTYHYRVNLYKSYRIRTASSDDEGRFTSSSTYECVFGNIEYEASATYYLEVIRKPDEGVWTSSTFQLQTTDTNPATADHEQSRSFNITSFSGGGGGGGASFSITNLSASGTDTTVSSSDYSIELGYSFNYTLEDTPGEASVYLQYYPRYDGLDQWGSVANEYNTLTSSSGSLSGSRQFDSDSSAYYTWEKVRIAVFAGDAMGNSGWFYSNEITLTKE
ncbi:hypothetical protein GF336_05695 [Candidatus Woesearchaeota archaeon]|nr:hypothetical protein [Candidatus Woesearchaeota archaeon]